MGFTLLRSFWIQALAAPNTTSEDWNPFHWWSNWKQDWSYALKVEVLLKGLKCSSQPSLPWLIWWSLSVLLHIIIQCRFSVSVSQSLFLENSSDESLTSIKVSWQGYKWDAWEIMMWLCGFCFFLQMWLWISIHCCLTGENTHYLAKYEAEVFSINMKRPLWRLMPESNMLHHR